MSRRSRKKRKGGTGGGRGFQLRVDRAWSVIVQPAFLGFLLFVAGLLLAMAPLSRFPETLSQGWWTTAIRFPDVTRSVASMLAVAAVCAAGVLWHRVRVVNGKQEPTGAADLALTEEVSGGPRGLLRWGPQVGVALMMTGVMIGLATWLLSHAALPTSRISVPPNRVTQSYPAIRATGALKVMLPSKIRVNSLDVTNRAATLEFISPGEEEGTVQNLVANEPIEVEGFRYALLGVEYDPRVARAVLSKSGPDTIDAAGSAGAKLTFAVDGESYEVKQVVRDYMGVMGPAVLLSSEEHGEFWVFQRASGEGGPEFDHGLSLQRLETGPVAVLAISSATYIEGIALGGLLFLLGLAAFLSASEVFTRRREDGEVVLAWSINDAGDLAERAGSDT